MPPELQPKGTFAPSEATPNPQLDELSLNKLQELVEWPSKMEHYSAKVAPEQPEDAPSEPAAEQPPEEPPEQPVAAEEAPAEPQVEPEAPPDEAAILQARLEAYEAEQQKLRAQLAGREAGERGYIKQLQQEVARLKSTTSSDEVAEEAPPPRNDTIATWAVSQAIQAAGTSFLQSHSDMTDLHEGVRQYLANSGYDSQPLLLSGDPLAASRETTRVLEEAYWHVKAEKQRARVAELQTRRADSMRGVEAAKKKAAISAGGGAAPPPKPVKQLQDLSLEELQQRVEKLGSRRG